MSLLKAAIIGMNDSAMLKAFSSQGREDLIVGLADVQQNRQPGRERNLQLGLEKLLLGISVQGFDKIIETDLADGDNSASFDKMPQVPPDVRDDGEQGTWGGGPARHTFSRSGG